MSALLLLALVGCGQESEETPSPAGPRVDSEARNVVLVVVDGLRPDHLKRNGFRRKTAPFLEELMETSAVFRNAFSAATSSAPTTASLLTSLYPPKHGLTESRESFERRRRTLETLGESLPQAKPLPTEIETLAELFAAAGYRTLGIVANPEATEARGFARGFQQYNLLEEGSAKEVAALAREWLAETEEPAPTSLAPTFLYLHFNDPQKPYVYRRPWYRDSLDPEKQARSAYASEISYTDKVLRELYEEQAWDHNTLLVVTSNHGEELWDHGETGHGFSLYNELLRILWFIHGPGVPSRSIEANVHLIDIAPTLLDLAGITFEPRDGLSHRHLLQDRPPPGVVHRLRGRTLFAHRERHRTTPRGSSDHLLAAIRGPYKLISGPEKEELFHWIDDPTEQRNLLGQASEPPEAADLRRALRGFRESFFVATETEDSESVDEKLERLLRESDSATEESPTGDS